ncbi:basic proline-rich protein-like [Lepus europaeus]|uniref:basic proline-rich protein-like n=1 Tax=Lepus europaeus TaxID=9983 RepID=UPI002B46BA8D|nr:basic proline-rich protein-like [Lepus europaeus]
MVGAGPAPVQGPRLDRAPGRLATARLQPAARGRGVPSRWRCGAGVPGVPREAGLCPLPREAPGAFPPLPQPRSAARPPPGVSSGLAFPPSPFPFPTRSASSGKPPLTAAPPPAAGQRGVRHSARGVHRLHSPSGRQVSATKHGRQPGVHIYTRRCKPRQTLGRPDARTAGTRLSALASQLNFREPDARVRTEWTEGPRRGGSLDPSPVSGQGASGRGCPPLPGAESDLGTPQLRRGADKPAPGDALEPLPREHPRQNGLGDCSQGENSYMSRSALPPKPLPQEAPPLPCLLIRGSGDLSLPAAPGRPPLHGRTRPASVSPISGRLLGGSLGFHGWGNLGPLRDGPCPRRDSAARWTKADSAATRRCPSPAGEGAGVLRLPPPPRCSEHQATAPRRCLQVKQVAPVSPRPREVPVASSSGWTFPDGSCPTRSRLGWPQASPPPHPARALKGPPPPPPRSTPSGCQRSPEDAVSPAAVGHRERAPDRCFALRTAGRRLSGWGGAPLSLLPPSRAAHVGVRSGRGARAPSAPGHPRRTPAQDRGLRARRTCRPRPHPHSPARPRLGAEPRGPRSPHPQPRVRAGPSARAAPCAPPCSPAGARGCPSVVAALAPAPAPAAATAIRAAWARSAWGDPGQRGRPLRVRGAARPRRPPGSLSRGLRPSRPGGGAGGGGSVRPGSGGVAAGRDRAAHQGARCPPLPSCGPGTSHSPLPASRDSGRPLRACAEGSPGWKRLSPPGLWEQNRKLNSAATGRGSPRVCPVAVARLIPQSQRPHDVTEDVPNQHRP